MVVKLLYYVIPAYDVVSSRTMRVIWDVYWVQLSCPYLQHYLWEYINNNTRFVEETGENDFSFRPVKTVF